MMHSHDMILVCTFGRCRMGEGTGYDTGSWISTCFLMDFKLSSRLEKHVVITLMHAQGVKQSIEMKEVRILEKISGSNQDKYFSPLSPILPDHR